MYDVDDLSKYERGRCPSADEQFESASRLDNPNYAALGIDPWISFPERRARPTATRRNKADSTR
ncbi:MAG: hypothetical protein NUV56_00535 [Candidatus Uhrbacteria bacterium]|nr:hypothetical protein [Candidatus Uhrbacteria bacterium]